MIELSVIPQEFDLNKLEDLAFEWAGETHTIGLSKIEGKIATIVVRSRPQFITLNIGENEDIDLDEDILKDISISLVSVENDVAKVKIKIIREGIILSDDVLKVSMHQSQILERKITIVHDWDKNLETVLANSLEKLVAVDPIMFSLLVKSKQPVVLTFNPQRDAALGTYTGTLTVSASASEKEHFDKIVNIVAEVESDSVLLDGGLDIREKTLQAGKELRVAVSVFNLQDVPVQNVTLLYEIFDQANNIKYSEQEYTTIDKQASFTKSISLPKNLPPGQYVLSLKIIYKDSFATATEIFTIEGKEKLSALAGLAAFAGGRTFLFAIPVMFVLIVGIVVVLFLTRRKMKIRAPTIIKERTIVKQRTIIKPRTIIKKDMSEYRRKLATLTEGYRKGYIKEDTYQKLKGKLEEIIRRGS